MTTDLRSLVSMGRKAADPEEEKAKAELDKDFKELKDALANKEIEKFLKGVQELSKTLHNIKRIGSKRVAASTDEALQALNNLLRLEENDIEALFSNPQVFPDLQKRADEAERLLEQASVDEFMEGLESLAEEAVKGVKTGSVLVHLSTLIKVAHDNPGTRPVLLPIITAKVKSQNKAKLRAEKLKKKKAEKEKAEKAEKAEKEKAAKKAKKRKATIERDDLDW
jgi:hypothetical protein